MSEDNKKVGIFQKALEAGNVILEAQIQKAKTQIMNQNVVKEDNDFFYSKAVVEDPSYSMHAQGWKEKPFRIQPMHLKQMSYQDTAVAGVIQTRQNQVANHSGLVKSIQEKGFMIELVDEDLLLEKIKEELRAEMEVENARKDIEAQNAKGLGDGKEDDSILGDDDLEQDPNVQKADDQGIGDQLTGEGIVDENPNDNDKTDDEAEAIDFELERKARKKLDEQFSAPRKKVEEYVLNCGKTDNRPFETKKWNFNTLLRAWTRDSLTYDLHGTEMVPDRAGRPHHFFPVDGGTVRFASSDLKKYKDAAANFYNIDILNPENTKEADEKQKVIDLDPKLLELDAYKWVQVVRGKIERAYTADELKVGIRNVNTDLYNNGYGIAELELLVTMVTGHLNAEYYNQAYFTQGFSAKGILHIKAALNRRKVETVRTQWQHMLKGARNSFQTPIFAGVEDVNWIPLTQNHNDIGFEGWMRYLITMIGVIYQIDPSEMGIHFKAEGGGGSLGDKDSTDEKIKSSKDRGLFPLLSHFEQHINQEIIKPFDARFRLRFTGVNGTDAQSTLDRQKEEVQWKKTVNEIRAEDGLPPLPGMDDVMLNPQYMAWYQNFSAKALAKAKTDSANQANQLKMGFDAKSQQIKDSKPAPPNPFMNGQEENPEADIYGEGATHMTQEDPEFGKSMKKIKVEVYTLKK